MAIYRQIKTKPKPPHAPTAATLVAVEFSKNRRIYDLLYHALGMSARWPTDWQGQTHIDCDADGQILIVVSTSSQPTGFHQKEFQLIIERWQTIWPEFKQVITELIESYKQDAPDWSNVRTLFLHIPDKPLAENSEWSIDVVFFNSDTLWSLPYSGFIPVRGRAQAIW